MRCGKCSPGLHSLGDDSKMKWLASAHHHLLAMSFRICHTKTGLPETETEAKHTQTPIYDELRTEIHMNGHGKSSLNAKGL